MRSWVVVMRLSCNFVNVCIKREHVNVFTNTAASNKTHSVLCNHDNTRSHPEMVGDMSRVTLNFDLSKIPFVLSSQGQDLYSHQKLNMYIYWFSSELERFPVGRAISEILRRKKKKEKKKETSWVKYNTSGHYRGRRYNNEIIRVTHT